jgi:type I restriction enzyme, S subunit
MSRQAASVPVGSVTTWLSGGTPDRANVAYWAGSIPWISATTLKRTRIYDSDQRITESAVRSGSKLAPQGATLMLVRGMALRREVRAGLAMRPVSFNQDVKALIPRPGLVPQYLTYSLHAQRARILELVSSAGSGTGVLDTGLLKRLPIWLPDSHEQKMIVDAIEDVDAAVEALERLIAKKQAIKLGMMQQLLTGKTRLPGFNGHWSRETVGAIADVKTGPFGSALHERDYVSQGTPIITVEHLGERGVVARDVPMVSHADRRRLSAYALHNGDVVFSRVGSIDRNALISEQEEGWLFSGRLLRVRFNRSKADPAFLSSQFYSSTFKDAVRAVAVGQTMPSLNTAILKGILVTVPPLDEQRAIGQVSNDLDRELDALDCRLEKAKAIKQGMMQQLLTGRTRLPVPEAVA